MNVSPSHPLFRRLAGALPAVLLTALLNAQAPAGGTIEGRVLNATSGNYLNNVRVAVKDTLLEAVTNQNGEYRISGVP